MTNVVCLHEDRSDHAVGLQLAIASLARHAPEMTVLVHAPALEQALTGWVARHSKATFIRLDGLVSSGWNVKPAVLQKVLERYDDVTWIDSDILLTKSIDRHFANLPDDLLLATEETRWGQQQGGDIRTRLWGLQPARTFPLTVNSGIVRVTRRHLRLLRAWQEMLVHPLYVRAQARPWYERPIHMVGDQDVLTALLGAADFAQLPVRLLERGRDIAQCFGPAGFTPWERLRSIVAGSPALIHAMGPKPWLRPGFPNPDARRGEKAAATYRSLSSEVSPYTMAARRFKDIDGIDLAWTNSRSTAAAAMVALGQAHPAISGLPLAIVDHAVRGARRALGIAAYTHAPDYVVRERPFEQADS